MIIFSFHDFLVTTLYNHRWMPVLFCHVDGYGKEAQTSILILLKFRVHSNEFNKFSFWHVHWTLDIYVKNIFRSLSNLEGLVF